MGRRIRWLGLAMMLCFALVLLQLVNIQFRRATALDDNAQNPRISVKKFDNMRGEILAADGTVLAKSVRSGASAGHYQWIRQYPGGSLYSQIVGYDSLDYGTNGVEYQYNSYLELHSQPATSLSQFFNPPSPTPDQVTLTIVPRLQQAAAQALSDIGGVNRDGAIVVLDPHTGAVLAMYSNPSFDPSGLAAYSSSTQNLARLAYNQPDAEGFAPDEPIATEQRFPPGSTSKVLTSAAVYDLKPKLVNEPVPTQECLALPDSDKGLCNDDGPCGGLMTVMLPESCDPGYGDLGLLLGGDLLSEQAADFGYNTVPPIDLPFVIPSAYPTAEQFQIGNPHCTGDECNLGPPGLAYSAIGQQDVDTTALQDALVAASIANGGVEMVPHVMAQIRNAAGNLVTSYQPTVWHQATTQMAAANITSLMQGVITHGTATGCISTSLDAAVKTGTAQTGNAVNNTDDWMIGFAPANNPQVAVAVVVPYQAKSETGAKVAGPVVNAMLGAALNLPVTAGFDCQQG